MSRIPRKDNDKCKSGLLMIGYYDSRDYGYD